MYDLTAVDVLEIMPSTSEQVQKFSTLIKNELLEGRLDFKKFLHQKSFIEKTLDAIYSDPTVKELLFAEIEKFGKDGVGYNDLKFTVENRSSYDYTQTGDSEYAALEERKKDIDKELKGRQKFLQTLQKPVADPETGELIYPAAKSTTTYIKTTTVKNA